jgi:hypothetical protein
LQRKTVTIAGGESTDTDDSAPGSEESDSPLSTTDGPRRWGLFVVVAVLCLSGTLLVGLTDLPNTHRHDVSADNEFPADERLGYEELSPAGQEAFRAALDTEGPVWTADPAPDFSYPSEEGAWITRVEYQGTIYRLSTERQIRGVTITVTGLRLSLLAAGILLLLAGGWPLLNRRGLDRIPSEREQQVTGRLLPVWAFVFLVPGLTSSVMSVLALSGVLTESLGSLLLAAAVGGITVSTASCVWFLRLVRPGGRLFFYSAVIGSVLWVSVTLTVLSVGVSTVVSTLFFFTFVVLYSVLGEILGWNVWTRLLAPSE